MKDNWVVNKIAVLGAGVMGAQIAAHCVNAGFKTLLFDMVPVDNAIQNLTKLSPAPLAFKEMAPLIQGCTYNDNIELLKDCDLIIEAIAEKLDWKLELYKKITPYIGPHAVLATNTSGLSIASLMEAMPKSLAERFCGMHFFNPPRYMHLVELVPSQHTAPSLLQKLETWLTSYLGKNVVIAKDTPNFIANRVGVFSLLSIMHHAHKFGLGFDEVDAITGSVIGRPKSATFRTMDVVGLDTMQHVVKTMHSALKSDPWHKYYHLPDWLMNMINQGHLGQKSGQGIYRKNGKVIEVFSLEHNEYRPSNAKPSEDLIAILNADDKASLWVRLSTSEDKQAKFITACLRDLIHYSAYHLEEIAHTVKDVDDALRYGFGWDMGPFQLWQGLGIQAITSTIEHPAKGCKLMAAVELPEWSQELPSFYSNGLAYCPHTKEYIAPKTLPVYQKQIISLLPSQSVLYENNGVILRVMDDDVGVLSFKSKLNCINQFVVEGLHYAIPVAERECQGLIICQPETQTFSAGADLKMVANIIHEKKYDVLDTIIKTFQDAMMKLKYSAIPTVAALRGQALGGGCEILLHCDVIVAAFESYVGLVEVGAGLIPAGGGAKEMALRASFETKGQDLVPALYRYYQNIATAFLAQNALEAKQKGYLRAHDAIIMHAEEVLFAAIAEVKAKVAANYRPPLPMLFPVAGIEGAARLKAGLVNWLEGGFISDNDYEIALKLAEVMTGGDVNQGTLVTEHWLLKLERQAFIELADTGPTQDRIKHLLETGKPLRN